MPRALADVAPQKSDGMNYAPRGKPNPVVKPGEFMVAAVRLDHGHIYGMCNGLTEAGATLKWVYDPDPKKTEVFRARYPEARAARSLDEVLADPEVRLVAAAAVTSERGPLGCQVMEAGKDYFTDKAPFTTMAQLEQARAVVARTGRKYMVYYSERLHNESAMFATDLVEQGAIGRVIHVINIAPHRLSKATRPDWFFQREKFGGILCDLGSHQFEQFLSYSGSSDATVSHAAIGNFNNPDHPGFEDFGEACLTGSSGALDYVRVDWFTPDGLSTWGDGRTFILGTRGTIELRKYVDIARDPVGDHLYIADEKGERHLSVAGQVGYRFFGEFILDCLNRTEKAMTQAHAFKAGELCLRAQAAAIRVT
jgi:predicted dehydrogenase